jgi:hypothetical protein
MEKNNVNFRYTEELFEIFTSIGPPRLIVSGDGYTFDEANRLKNAIRFAEESAYRQGVTDCRNKVLVAIKE